MPQQTAVWFLLEDGQLKLSLNTSRQKTKNLMKRPQCSLLVLDPAVPQRYLEVRGTVEIEPDDDYAFARQARRQVRRRGSVTSTTGRQA